MPEKKHGNTGNQNARKYDEPQQSTLMIRCTTRDKSAWVKQAQRAGVNLTEFVRRALFAATDDDLKS